MNGHLNISEYVTLVPSSLLFKYKYNAFRNWVLKAIKIQLLSHITHVPQPTHNTVRANLVIGEYNRKKITI